jgi:uncharacterized protein YjbJ (UPF0337 family)
MTERHVDDAKGRLKEAAGAVSGDDSLKREGKVDQAKASVKDAIDGAVDKIGEAKERVTGERRDR